MSDERTQGMSAQITNLEKAADDVSGQAGHKREFTRRELFKLVVPRNVLPSRGRLILDRTKCTMCTLCTQECLSGALIVDGVESVSLVFEEDKCDSCGLCIKVCPENCLKLERSGEKTGKVILIEDEFARCTRCGKIIGPKTMINKIGLKLSKVDPALLWLCPECKGENISRIKDRSRG